MNIPDHGAMLKAVLVAHGIELQQVAEILGVRRNVLSDIVKSRCRLTREQHSSVKRMIQQGNKEK